MLPHARVMIHDPLVQSVGGSALQLKSYSDDLMRTREIMGEILSSHTGKSLEEIFLATSKDSYFEAQAAYDYGLADRIITSL